MVAIWQTGFTWARKYHYQSCCVSLNVPAMLLRSHESAVHQNSGQSDITQILL